MGATLHRCDFINGGHEIACAAIRAEVKGEYADRWSKAKWRERWRLWAEINAEVRRRAARLAPQDAFY
jgi:hypothetical protein